MSKHKTKDKGTFSRETPSLDDSHKLKTSAVDRLVEASKGDASGITDEDTKQVKSKRLPLPTWLKAILVKWWFVGASCFFFYWGLGNYIADEWSKILVLGLGTGAVTDILTNNFFRLLETSEHEYNPYMLFNKKHKIWTLIVYAVYSLVITVVIVKFYDFVNALIIKLNSTKYAVDDVPFPVEPVSYGLVYLAFDMIVITIKNLFVSLFKKNKQTEA